METPIPFVIEGATLASVLALLLYALILLLKKYDLTQPLPLLAVDPHSEGTRPIETTPLSELAEETHEHEEETCHCATAA